jgi:hypothetical protein
MRNHKELPEVFKITIPTCEVWGFYSDIIVYSRHMGCDAVSFGQLLPTIRTIVVPSSSGFGLLYPEDRGTTIFRNIGNISPNDTEWHLKDLNFNLVIVSSFIWDECWVCISSLFKIWSYISMYSPMFVRTAAFMYEILFIRLFDCCYIRTTCKLRSWKTLTWEV